MNDSLEILPQISVASASSRAQAWLPIKPLEKVVASVLFLQHALQFNGSCNAATTEECAQKGKKSIAGWRGADLCAKGRSHWVDILADHGWVSSLVPWELPPWALLARKKYKGWQIAELAQCQLSLSHASLRTFMCVLVVDEAEGMVKTGRAGNP